ncbi:MAG: hypothetical protein WCH57_04675 [Verrucomicrobiota bacterium]
MHPVSRTLLVFLCLGGFALAKTDHSPLHSQSPDGKWEATVKWVPGDAQENGPGDWFLELQETGSQKILRGPRVEEKGDRTVLWSPDGHYLAAGGGVMAIEGGKLLFLGRPWESAALQNKETFEASLLKDAEKKRYLAHLREIEKMPRHEEPPKEDTYCKVFPLEWANNTDLVLHCSLRVILDDPEETLDVIAKITVRVGKPGTERILRGKYDAYEIVGKEAFRSALPEASPTPEEEPEEIPPLTCTLASPKDVPAGRIYESEQAPEPNGLQLFTYKPNGGSEHEFWVRETATGRASRLYTYDRGFAQASLSAGGKYVAIVDRAFSNASVIAVLERDAKGQFRRLKTGDIPEKGVQLLAKIFSLTPPPKINHLYCNTMGAPDDDGILGVVIWGYASGEQKLEHWCFRYNTATGEASVEDEAAVRATGSPLHPLQKGP